MPCARCLLQLLFVMVVGAQSVFAEEFTVEDAITAEWYVDLKSAFPVLGDEGEYPSIDAVAYSPNRRRAVFLTRRGNLEAGMTDFTLHLATLVNGEVSHKELVRLSSSSNRPVISAVRWVSADRIGFIGSRGSGAPQVMSVNIMGELTEHTTGEGKKLSFDIGADGTAVYAISVLPSTFVDWADSPGYVVGNKSLADIVGVKRIGWRRPTEYYVARSSKTRHLDGLSNGTSSFPPFISISPNGRYAVVATGPSHVPEEWATFPLRVKASAGAAVSSLHSKLSLIDLQTGGRHELSGAPMAWPSNETQIVWDETHNRLILIDQFVSSAQAAQLDGFSDKLRPATFEFSLKAMRPAQLIDVSPAPERYAEGVAADSAHFFPATGMLEIIRGDRLIRYEETSWSWRREGGSDGARAAPERPFALEVHQGVDEPAQMYAVIAGREDAITVGEINAPLKGKFNPSRLYEWTDEAGRKWHAGLILPRDVSKGEALPLIIQTHSFSPHEFVMTGARGSSAGFSGQALASAGFAVLNMGLQRREILTTAEEFETQSDGYRSAITTLSEDGIIDPARVGVIAWSRSGFWLQHALAFQDDLFAAAIASDASTFGKFGYIYFHNWPGAYQGDYLVQTGVPPFGEWLNRWRSHDPVTHVRAFETPLLIEDYGGGVPLWWEPYVAMKEAGEPVEYFILPSAPHDPIQPEHRFVVQTLTLDWFRFWLQGHEDPDPEKEEQYARWRKMRDERCAWDEPEDEKPPYCEYSNAVH